VLDEILVEAAVEAEAEVREEFVVRKDLSFTGDTTGSSSRSPPTDGLTCLVAGRPMEYYREFSFDVEKRYHETIAIAPELADAIRKLQPVESYVGMAVSHYFGRPYGPGWALVGDSVFCMDSLKGHGISDAFCDAELLADAIDASFSDRQPLEDVLAEYESDRNARKGGYYDRNWTASHMEGWDDPTVH